MKFKLQTISIIVLISCFLSPLLAQWKSYDGIIAIVNSQAIVKSEIDSKFKQLSKQKRIPRIKIAATRSKILDEYIERAIISEAAAEQSIIVNDTKVLNEVKKMMRNYFRGKIKLKGKKYKKYIEKIKDRLSIRMRGGILRKKDKIDRNLDQFIKYIERTRKMKFVVFFEDLRVFLKRRMVISIAIGITPPKKADAKRWYYKNLKRLGEEIWVKHILIRPRGNSFTAQRAASKKISTIRRRALRGESFEKLARTYSEDGASKYKGGDLGWVVLAKADRFFANMVNQLYRKGQISQVFKTAKGYHVVKYIARRPVSFKQVEDLIFRKLYGDNVGIQYKRWIRRKRAVSEIIIYMKNYKKSKS